MLRERLGLYKACTIHILDNIHRNERLSLRPLWWYRCWWRGCHQDDNWGHSIVTMTNFSNMIYPVHSRSNPHMYTCKRSSIWVRSYVPRVLCSPGPMFPRTYVPRVRCSPILCSPVPMFPDTYEPLSYIPRYLCSPVPIFPGTYVPPS